MRQYNRIMLGEHGKYLADCLANNYIGANFLKDTNLSSSPFHQEEEWRKQQIDIYCKQNPEKSIQTARTSIGFLWTICFGLRKGDIVLASNGEGGYQVGEITGDYYFAEGNDLPHRRSVNWLAIVIARKSMSQKLQNSSGSIGTCCNLTKYAEEIDILMKGEKISSSSPKTVEKTEKYKERSLHKLLSNYLMAKRNVFSKTIFHECSTKSDQAQKWVHPDMVGVEFNEFQDAATRTLLKTAETKEYMNLYSFELKRSIENDHQLKEYFFQALSNSSWANYGYLVAFEINGDVMEEMERLNRSFGIGVIELSSYSDDTKILFQARKNELDYYTIDKLCRINPDFRNFITKTTRVLNAQSDVLEDVKSGLQHFCDKVFYSQEELLAYCKECHIPC